MMQRSLRPRRGMTLIEIMVALALLLTGLVTIFAMVTAALRSHKRAMNETEAALVASSALEEVRASFARGEQVRSAAEGTSESAMWDDSTDYPGYQIKKTIVPLEIKRGNATGKGVGREFFTRIEVRWSREDKSKSVVVDSIVYLNDKPGRPPKPEYNTR